jgi:peptidoglycan/LPS O-acetylase OafA/YrhL
VTAALCKAYVVSFQQRLTETSYKGPGFDQIRLVAATIVVLHHSTAVQYRDIQFDWLFQYSGGYIHFGFLAVAVFFAISGFLVTPGLLKSGNVIKYFVHRFLRILPALFVVVVVSMFVLGPALTNLSLSSYLHDPSLYRYGKNILTLSERYLPGIATDEGNPIVINGALWTLHFEVLSYVALALFSVLTFLKRPRMFLGLSAAIYIIYLVMNFAPTLTAYVPDRFTTFIGLFVYFQIGAALYVFRESVPFSRVWLMIATGAALIALPIGLGPVFMPLCLPYIVAFCGLSDLPGKAFLRRDLSYGIYLIHAPIIVAFHMLFPGVKIWPVAAAIVLLIAALLAYLSWTFVEAPALRQKKVVSDWASSRVDAAWATFTKSLLRRA